MKSKVLKIMTIIMFVMINLFFCFFTNTVNASTSELETVKDGISRLLQKAAMTRSSDYFNFDALKLVKQNRYFYTFTEQPNDPILTQYNIFRQGAYCMSLRDSGTATNSLICAVLDVLEDGTVQVTTKSGVKTFSGINDQKVLIAHQLVYLASKSLDNNETNTSFRKDMYGNVVSVIAGHYKYAMTYGIIAPKFSYLQQLGVPAYMNPNWSGASIDAGTMAIINESATIAKKMEYTGRIIFLYGGGSRQNQFIFSGKKIDGPSIQIKKTDTKGKVLKGAKFNIYQVSSKGKEKLLGSGTTNSSGLFTFRKGLKVGQKYRIEEVKPPTGYLDADPSSKTITLKKGVNKVTFKNEKKPAIEIVKVDKDDNSIRLANAYFDIYEDAALTKKIASGKTKNDGRLVISSSKLKIGRTYYIVETKAPKGYVIDETPVKKVTLHEGNNRRTFYNSIRPIEIGLVKRIKGTNVGIEGVKFYVWVKPEEEPGREPQTSDSKYWSTTSCTHALVNVNAGKTDAEGNPLPPKWQRPHSYDRVYTGASQYAADHAEWEEKKRLYEKYLEVSAAVDGYYYTDEEGKIQIGGLPSDLDYFAREEELPGELKDYFQIDSTAAVAFKPDSLIIFTDTRIAIDLEGFVWQEEGQGKQYVTDNLYNPGDERLVPGIKVVLKKNGAEVDSTVTDAEGHYEFKKLKVADLNQYSVEFEYNGMKYYSIPTMIEEDYGSKASDLEEMRDDLNDRYNTITKAQEQGASDTYGVDYDVSDYKSEIIYRPNDDYAQTKYNLRASTQGICDFSSSQFYYAGNDYITNINLGIKEREQPDLALTEDLDRVEISFSGTSHTFNYGERTEAVLNTLYNLNQNGEEEISEDYELSEEEESSGEDEFIDGPIEKGELVEIDEFKEYIDKKFAGSYANMSYTRTLFPADIAHPSDSLDVKAVYKIGLENQATTLASRVNEFKFYFDSGYEMTSTEIEMSKAYSQNSIDSIEVQNGVAVVKLNQQTEDTKVSAQTRKFVYIVVNVKRSTMEGLLIRNTSNAVTLNSYAEITSYTTYEDGEPVAGVDVDSRPDSVDISNIKTFEDDTDRAPGFNLILQEERQISGTVFEDKAEYTEEQQQAGITEEGLNTGQERKGNGYYDEEEPKIANVTVRLTDTSGNTVQRYDLRNDQWVPAETTTDSNGNYMIDGIIPGLYQIRYTWGNQEYIAENYKSTIVDESAYQAKLSDEHWYSNSFKFNYMESGARYSDAVDDPELRKQVDEQSNDMRYQSLTEQKQGNTKMTSITPNFRVNYEYSQHNETSSNFSNYEFSTTTGYKDGWTVMIKAYNYNNKIEEIDLGIIRRAKQELELTKRVKRVLLTLQNGQILIDAEVIEKDGKYQLKDNVQDTVYIPTSDAANGMIKIETNNEINQSANLSITYEFIINNIGEVEYLTDDYYKYGKVPETEAQREETVAKIKPESMIDYMDNAKITLQSEDWELLEKPYQLVEDGFISPEIEESVNKVPKVMQIDNVMKDENAYLSPVGMKNPSTVSIEMLVSKLMAPTEEFYVGNEAELIRTIKTGGSIVTETHGNYEPGNTAKEEGENDDSRAEDVTVLPPTGENQNYMIPIAIGISAMVLLGVGVVLIRKFVLK